MEKRRAQEFSQKLMHDSEIGHRYDNIDHHFENYEISKGMVNGNELNFVLGDLQSFYQCQELVADFQRVRSMMNIDTDNHLNDYLRFAKSRVKYHSFTLGITSREHLTLRIAMKIFFAREKSRIGF